MRRSKHNKIEDLSSDHFTFRKVRPSTCKVHPTKELTLVAVLITSQGVTTGKRHRLSKSCPLDVYQEFIMLDVYFDCLGAVRPWSDKEGWGG